MDLSNIDPKDHEFMLSFQAFIERFKLIQSEVVNLQKRVNKLEEMIEEMKK